MKSLLTIALVLFSISLFSQNILFDQGQSGFHASAQFTSHDGSTLFGLAPGYTSNGKLTFGILIGTESNDDINSTVVKPFLSYLLVKQGENDMPISVSADIGYQYNTFSDLDLTAGTVGINAGIYHRIEASDIVAIIPGGTVGWSRTTFNLNNNTTSDSGITYGLQASVLINQFYFTPYLTFSSGDSIFSLLLGYIF